MTIIVPNATAGGPSTSKGPATTFTGDVYVDKVGSDGHTLMANVMFTPGARTNWHTHEGGQLLKVTAGSGWVCDRGERPRRIRAGDVAWCPAGCTHWHGADDGSFMQHFVLAHGKVEWLEAVTDEEYRAKA